MSIVSKLTIFMILALKIMIMATLRYIRLKNVCYFNTFVVHRAVNTPMITNFI